MSCFELGKSSYVFDNNEYFGGDREMAQQLKVFAAIPGDLN